ncbi:MAG: GNAT family N-acetyltransferase [Rhizobiales bacterium]|nr:GNAT family N-acetyltransferase [Hyphomicrobiales bacterium]
MILPSPLPPLRTARLVLRRPIPTDIADRLALGRDPEIYRNLGADTRNLKSITDEQAKAWVDNIASHPAAWVIEHQGRAIGEILIDNFVEADQRAGLIIGVLDPTCLGKGLGTEAIKAVAEFCFDVLGLHKLSMRVLSFNTRAIRAYERVGFVREGLERESAFIGGVWYDDVIVGLLKRDFDALRGHQPGKSETAPPQLRS